MDPDPRLNVCRYEPLVDGALRLMMVREKRWPSVSNTRKTAASPISGPRLEPPISGPGLEPPIERKSLRPSVDNRPEKSRSIFPKTCTKLHYNSESVARLCKDLVENQHIFYSIYLHLYCAARDYLYY